LIVIYFAERIDKEKFHCNISTLYILYTQILNLMDEIPDEIPDEIRTSRGFCNPLADKSLTRATSNP
jgi:hypothetical protein